MQRPQSPTSHDAILAVQGKRLQGRLEAGGSCTSCQKRARGIQRGGVYHSAQHVGQRSVHTCTHPASPFPVGSTWDRHRTPSRGPLFVLRRTSTLQAPVHAMTPTYTNEQRLLLSHQSSGGTRVDGRRPGAAVPRCPHAHRCGHGCGEWKRDSVAHAGCTALAPFTSGPPEQARACRAATWRNLCEQHGVCTKCGPRDKSPRPRNGRRSSENIGAAGARERTRERRHGRGCEGKPNSPGLHDTCGLTVAGLDCLAHRDCSTACV